MNLATVMNGHVGDSVALIDGAVSVSYADLATRVAKMQTHIRERSVGVGDVVASVIGNDIDFAVATLAVLGLGGIATPLNPSSPLPELVRKLAVANPKLLLVGSAGKQFAGLDAEIGVPTLDVTELDLTGPNGSERDGSGPSLPTIVDRNPEDAAFYMATSGVSGDAKVAILSHGNLGWVQEAMQQVDPPIGADDVLLGVLPFSHIFGLNVVLLAALRAGASVVVQHRFDADESLRLVREHGVTTLAGAPPMWQRWAQADVPDDALATLRFATSGAAALPLGVFEQVRDRFGIEISQGYGLTETSPVVTHGRGMPVRPASVGKVLSGVEVVLVDDDGTPVAAGDEGEIVVRGPGVFVGYLGDQEATDAVLTDDGWLWTGDVGIFDEDGYLYLVDRIKDIVIVSGFNVYPAEVENVLMQHPLVSGAIVTGTSDAHTGEAVVAHICGTATEEELAVFAAQQLSRYKRPTEYHFLDELPIAANGKAVRRALR
jgi:long-chain acyl-CoA synthetase